MNNAHCAAARRVEAMDWIQRLSEDGASEEDVLEWLGWYESDEANRTAFDDMQRFWAETRALEGRDSVSLQRQAVARPRSRASRGFRAFAFPTALAASLVVTLALLPVSSLAPRRDAIGFVSTDPHALTRHSVLPDGSVIDLAARTSVAVNYMEGLRSLVLNGGEAYFTVAPNHSRPFIVRSGEISVRAVGTQFDVRDENDRVIVAITEGTVEVTVGPNRDSNQIDGLRVGAGNEVVFDKRTQRSMVRAVDLGRPATWREGRLDYVHAPLSAIIEDLQRYTNINITIRDADAARLTYTGTVFLVAVDEWLRAIPKEFPVQVARRNGEIQITHASKPNGHAAP